MIGQVSDNGKQKFFVMSQFPEKLAVARTKTVAGDDIDVIVFVDEVDGKIEATPMAVIVDKEMFKNIVDPLKVEGEDAGKQV